jgi:prolyl oligopeptidase
MQVLSSLAVLCLLPGATRAATDAVPVPAPVAPARPVVESHFGTTLTDPYRWLENLQAPEVDEWLRAQDLHTRQTLARSPGRAAWAKQLDTLTLTSAEVKQVERWGDYYFILRLDHDAQTAKLYVRRGLDGSDRLLVDPAAFDAGGSRFVINYFRPSPDGARVALGLSPNGAHDRSVLRIIEVATGKWLPEELERTLMSGDWFAWMPDGRSFIYPQFAAPSGPRGALYENNRLRLHVLGTAPKRDRVVFGDGVGPALAPTDMLGISLFPHSRYLFATVQKGIRPERTIYATELAALPGPQLTWKKLIDADAQVTDFAARDEDLYLVTRRASPRSQVVRTRISAPKLEHAAVVAGNGDSTVVAIALGSDGLYVRSVSDSGVGRLDIISLSGNMPRVRSISRNSALSGLFTNPALPGAIVRSESWVRAPAWLLAAKASEGEASFGAGPTADTSALESLEVEVPGKDGTLIPLSIIHKKGIARDGSHPTWLMGYGAYGVSMEPSFEPLRLPWLERGGVFAIAHVRGGGERGEDWHRAGMKERKQNGVDDFISCARYLISERYTTASRLVAQGRSAGGLLIGDVITHAPELFGAAIINVGALDMIRIENELIGPINVPEFGSIKVETEFKSLLRMSPYHRVRDGVRYPAVLLTTGLLEANVSPWHSAKMAARLQAATASGKPILLRVDSKAGHGYNSTREEKLAEQLDTLSFLSSVLAE